MNEEIYFRLRTLGAFRASCAAHVWGMYWTSDEKEAFRNVRNVMEERIGIGLILDFLGLKLEGDPVIRHPIDPHDFVNTLLDDGPIGDCLFELIKDAYGPEAALTFTWSQVLTSIYILSDAFCKLRLSGPITERSSLIKKQRNRAMEFLKEIAEAVPRHVGAITHLFSSEIAALTNDLTDRVKVSEPTPRHFCKIRDTIQPAMNLLLPDYEKIEERLDRAMDLRMELLRCPSGQKDWRLYEQICMKILRFVFIPPFRTVLEQIRNTDGYERRDAILPNNSNEGFWGLIRDEFQSRHVVCEFKNGRSRLGKNDLNQLRIYLAKPTIGRFGLMFVRKPPNKSLKKAQRDAYEQAKTLILILDDEKVINLIYSRCFFGSADDFLEREKICFEVNY